MRKWLAPKRRFKCQIVLRGRPKKSRTVALRPANLLAPLPADLVGDEEGDEGTLPTGRCEELRRTGLSQAGAAHAAAVEAMMASMGMGVRFNDLF